MKHIKIIGKGIGWLEAPRDGEIWTTISTVGNLLAANASIARVFDIHDRFLEETISTSEKELETHLSSMKTWDALVEKNNIPYYVCEVLPKMPSSVRYPLEDVIRCFGVDYLTNSIAYMIALALYERVTKIDIYGVNMSTGSEYFCEKGGVEFWIGYALGRGTEVNVHGNGELLKVNTPYGKGNLYGYGIKQGG